MCLYLSNILFVFSYRILLCSRPAHILRPLLINLFFFNFITFTYLYSLFKNLSFLLIFLTFAHQGLNSRCLHLIIIFFVYFQISGWFNIEAMENERISRILFVLCHRSLRTIQRQIYNSGKEVVHRHEAFAPGIVFDERILHEGNYEMKKLLI